MSYERTNIYIGEDNLQSFKNLVNETGTTGFLYFSSNFEDICELKQIDLTPYLTQTDINTFITQNEVNTASNALYAQISSIDLTPFLTQTDINTFITQNEVNTASNALYAQISSIDLTPFLTQTDINTFITQNEVNTASNALYAQISSIDLTPYLTQTDINTFITQNEVDTASNALYTQISSIDLTPYLTQTDINTFITQNEVDTASNALYTQISSIDLTPYLTQTDINTFITQNEVNTASNALYAQISSIDLTPYLTQTDINTFITQNEVNTASNALYAQISSIDLTPYLTQTDINTFITQNEVDTASNALYAQISSIDLTPYLTQTDINTFITQNEVNTASNALYAQISSIDLTPYLTQTDINTFITQNEVDTASNALYAQISSIDLTPYLTQTDINTFITQNEVDTASNALYAQISSIDLTQGGSSVWTDETIYIQYSNIRIFENSIKLVTGSGENPISSYLYYTFTEDPSSVNTLVNQGTGSVLDGEIFNNLTKTTGPLPNTSAYYWNNNLSNQGDNACIKLPKEVIDPIITSMAFTIAYWHKFEDDTTKKPILSLKQDESNDIINIYIDSNKRTNIDIVGNDFYADLSPLDGVFPSATHASGTNLSAMSNRNNDTVFICDAIFPSTITVSACLFEFGGSGIGVWVGIKKDSKGGNYFRARCGNGGSIPTKNGSISGCCCIDIDDFPQDGLSHNVIVSISMSSYTLDVYIDGIFKGSNTSSGSFSQIAGTNGGGWGQSNGSVCTDETTAAWNSNIGASVLDVLKQYTNYYLSNFKTISNTWMTTSSISTNQWHHNVFTMTYINSYLTVDYYLDNVKQTSSALTVPNFTFPTTTVDSYGLIGSNNELFDASPSHISEFRIFDNPVTDVEIGYIFNPSTIPPSTQTYITDFELSNASNNLIEYINNNSSFTYDDSAVSNYIFNVSNELVEYVELNIYDDSAIQNSINTLNTVVSNLEIPAPYDDTNVSNYIFNTSNNLISYVNNNVFDGNYNNLINIPSSFPPISHNHTINDITNLQTTLNSKQNTIIPGQGIKIDGTTLSVRIPPLTTNDIFLYYNNDILNVSSYSAGQGINISNGVISATGGGSTNITGGASTIVTQNLTSNRALISNGSGKVAVSAVTSTELGYLDGVTSSIQNQINNKQNTITGGASTILSTNLTGSRVLISNGSGKVAVSTITFAELSYLDNVSSPIQTQLNNKQNLLIPGSGISIINNTISATGAGGGSSLWSTIPGGIQYVGGKICINDSHEGDTNGIYMWRSNDPNWSIYMSRSGQNNSFSGGYATVGADFSLHAIRIRVLNQNNYGFIIENSSEMCLMSIHGSTGSTYIRGNTGIKHAPTAYALTVGGSVNVLGTVFEASDEKLKKNICNIEEDCCCSKLYRLKGKKYNFKKDKKDTFGFVAQEVQQIYPDLVAESESDGEKTLALNYSAFIPLLLENIKMLEKRISVLERDRKK
jgi:hypothetical protein